MEKEFRSTYIVDLSLPEHFAAPWFLLGLFAHLLARQWWEISSRLCLMGELSARKNTSMQHMQEYSYFTRDNKYEKNRKKRFTNIPEHSFFVRVQL